MSNFEEKLDASISKVLNEAKLSDELYKKYQQFVGALDALPQDQIASDRFTSDIHDQFGRVRPFSMWPTKASRAKSEKVWLTYNQRLQLAQAAKEGGTAPEDPTDDPDFLGQLLDTCVRTSMSMGQLDRKTAFRHCSKQVQRFEQAIRGALTDRGLPKKEVEEFTKELLKGMANGKQIDMKDLSVEDRQFIQDLADSLTYRPKSESIVKEDLDDKDEFTNCLMCSKQPEIDQQFHFAHVAASSRATKECKAKFTSAWRALTKPHVDNAEYTALFKKAFSRDMQRYGYAQEGNHWAKMVKEDLDDKDEFRADCHYCSVVADQSPGIDRNAFHHAHATIERMTPKRLQSSHERYVKSMSQFGFIPIDPDDSYRWTFQKPLKEDIDDRDEFEPCEYKDCVSKSAIHPKFHDAHVEAAAYADAAYAKNKSWSDFVKNFAIIMSKYGFVKDREGSWTTNEPVKEDLDDKDEFDPDCPYCEATAATSPGLDTRAFHVAHRTVVAARGTRIPWKDFTTGMSMHGFTAGPGLGQWSKIQEGHHYGGEYHEDPPASIKVGDLDLKVGDWIELGPIKAATPPEGLDDQDEFGGQEDFPITPVEVVSISDVTRHYRDQSGRNFLVRLSNSNLLSLPDKFGVRWHGRPKHHRPAWYEEWYAPFADDILENYYNKGQLRKVDNIEQWFQSQPTTPEQRKL